MFKCDRRTGSVEESPRKRGPREPRPLGKSLEEHSGQKRCCAKALGRQGGGEVLQRREPQSGSGQRTELTAGEVSPGQCGLALSEWVTSQAGPPGKTAATQRLPE